MVNIFDITKCNVPPREKILPGLISDCSIPEMYFPPICSCPEFSIRPPLDPPAIPCIVAPVSQSQTNNFIPPPPTEPGQCKLAEECCPEELQRKPKKLCYDPTKKPDWGKTLQKDKIQYEPKDEDCQEPCGEVLWLANGCPDPCKPITGGGPCVEDPCENEPGDPDYVPVIPPTTGNAVDDCCWFMWCPCNITKDTLAYGNYGGGHNSKMFPVWPNPKIKDPTKCPSPSDNITGSTTPVGAWVRITGQGKSSECGNVNPPGIMGRYWGEVAIVCFCKITPGSGLSFPSLLPPASTAMPISTLLGSSLSVRGFVRLGSGMSLRALANCGKDLGSIHPIDNQYAQCCVCVVLTTGPGQDIVNGTYCKKQLADTEYLREGHAELKITKKGAQWIFEDSSIALATGLPKDVDHPSEIPVHGWKTTAAGFTYQNGCSFGETRVIQDKCEGTDAGEYMFNRLNTVEKNAVIDEIGEGMWSRAIQRQTIVHPDEIPLAYYSFLPWSPPFTLRADGPHGISNANLSATGNPSQDIMTISFDSYNTAGGEWFVGGVLLNKPYIGGKGPHHVGGFRVWPWSVHPWLMPFHAVNITVDIATKSSSSTPAGQGAGQTLGLLIRQNDGDTEKFYGVKLGNGINSGSNTDKTSAVYSRYTYKGLTASSFCQIDDPKAVLQDACSFKSGGFADYILEAGHGKYPSMVVDGNTADAALTDIEGFSVGYSPQHPFTHYGRPLMISDSHPRFSNAEPLQFGLFVAHQAGLNVDVIKPDVYIKNLFIEVGC